MISASTEPQAAGADGARRERAAPSGLEIGIAFFAVLHLGLAVLMAADPHLFYKDIGPFGAYNSHYIRDVSTFYAAFGAGLAISLVRPSWRVPALAMTTIQYGLHSINHLFDIANAHPAWTGYFDFFSLAAATLLLASLTRAAAAAARRQHAAATRAPSPDRQGALR